MGVQMRIELCLEAVVHVEVNKYILRTIASSSSKFQDTDIVKRHEPCLGHATVAVKKYCYEWVWLISTDLA